MLSIIHLAPWLLLTHTAVAVVVALFAWNNPKARISSIINDEMTKAKAEGKTELVSILDAVKSKL